MHYFDTSIILKSYVHESRSEEAISLLDKTDSPIPISHILQIEFHNALNLKAFRKELTRREVENFRRAFQSDLKSGCFYFPVQDSLEVLKRAISISNQYTAKVGSRTLDILHIAFAVETACTTFNTFDSRQSELASRLKIPTL